MNFLNKLFSIFKNSLLMLGIVKYSRKRGGYHIGWLAPEKTLPDLKLYLHKEWGFGNHFISWTDKGQVLSWRVLDGAGGQYHLRVYEDGEIRGHYEFEPKEHPLGHISGKGDREDREKFLEFLGEFIVKRKYVSNIVADPNAFDPSAEILESKEN